MPLPLCVLCDLDLLACDRGQSSPDEARELTCDRHHGLVGVLLRGQSPELLVQTVLCLECDGDDHRVLSLSSAPEYEV